MYIKAKKKSGRVIICLPKIGLPKNAVAVRKDRNDGIKNSKAEKKEKKKTPDRK